MSTFEEQYMGVLQNIEFALLSTSQDFPELCDHNISRVVDAVIEYYKSKARNALPPSPHLSSHEHTMLERVKSICDWRLGLNTALDDQLTPVIMTTDEILLCLKRIQKSIKFWTKQGGRRGYINFVMPHVLAVQKNP